ncbi:MAG TPA: SpoIIE family protein phosphatase [Gemmataceae bacterium]|nr:SpoIIE family protein phosphatase [Gemmataceae bacterium]
MDSTIPILLVAANQQRHAELRSALEALGYALQPYFFNSSALTDLAACRLAIVDSGEALEDAVSFSERWNRSNGPPLRPLLWLADAADHAARLAGWKAGAAACLIRPLVTAELQAEVTALLRVEEECRRLHLQAQERNQLNQTLLRNYQERDAVCRLAERIQRSFQIERLPELQRAKFAVIRRARSDIGGDYYGVRRVDADQALFYLGDMMAHSLIASLLAGYIQQLIVPRDAAPERLLQPAELLREINRHLIGLGFPEHPLGCLTCGLLNGRTGELRFAAAGHTPRIYLPREGAPECWPEAGSLLGLDGGHYPLLTRQLHPGDRLLLFTDGLMGNGPDTAKTILNIYGQHRDQPLAGLLATLTQELLVQTPEPDDFTMLGMEILA